MKGKLCLQQPEAVRMFVAGAMSVVTNSDSPQRVAAKINPVMITGWQAHRGSSGPNGPGDA